MNLIFSNASSLFLLVACTAFLKILLVINILRFGLGLRGIEGGIVSLGLAVALTWLTVASKFPDSAGMDQSAKVFATLAPEMEKVADKDLLKRFTDAAQERQPGSQAANTMPVPSEVSGSVHNAALVASFVITELRDAVTMGCKMLIPFIVIDLLVSHIFLLLGLVQLPAAVAAFPLKLALFIAVDGWRLLSERLIGI